ncbi:thiamine pyrophosphate protein (plasmid) [Mesorhizobium sp. 113-3-3]|nr:thiamine pyrophosphate protein [Mesorhizobium sp. 113-3-3]
MDSISCVPGESYLAVLDALYDEDINILTCRSEAGAAMMADAYGKLTGRPGICMVSRGPGATNASPAVHIANHDSTPLILFIGQVNSTMREREAFQEIDYKAMFGGIAKWVMEIDRPERVPELVTMAFRIAMQGRPGPVVVSLPEDMLIRTCKSTDGGYVAPSAPTPARDDVLAVLGYLQDAKSPLIVLGGTSWLAQDRHLLGKLAEKYDVPVATSFRGASLLPPIHPANAGDLGLGRDARLRERLATADVVLLIGGRMSEISSHSYTLLEVPAPRQRIIRVHPDSMELSRMHGPTLEIEATPHTFCSVLAECLRGEEGDGFKPRVDEAHKQFVEQSEKSVQLPGEIQFGEMVRWLGGVLPDDGIICIGAGNYTGWLARHFCFGEANIQLASTSSSMGYSVPAAVMAKHIYRHRIIVAFATDDCFMTNGQEFATAVQYKLPIIVIVLDNCQYGTIRLHQERDYPGRVIATRLRNPNFAGFAKAFDGYGEVATDLEEFKTAFSNATASGVPSIIHCKIDPLAVTRRD